MITYVAPSAKGLGVIFYELLRTAFYGRIWKLGMELIFYDNVFNVIFDSEHPRIMFAANRHELSVRYRREDRVHHQYGMRGNFQGNAVTFACNFMNYHFDFEYNRAGG